MVSALRNIELVAMNSSLFEMRKLMKIGVYIASRSAPLFGKVPKRLAFGLDMQTFPFDGFRIAEY